MVSTNITKIYFRGNEIVALYRGDTLIFRKSPRVYKIKGTVTKSSGNTQFNLYYNDNKQSENVKVNQDLTFETELKEPLTSANGMFRGMSYLETLDLNGLDTSQVTNMSNMFSQSNYLKDIKLNIDTSKVTNMSNMFSNCQKLISLDLTNFDTSKVTDMNFMFYDCASLETLDLSNFNTINVKSVRQMISFCNKLKTVDASNFDTRNLSDFQSMFGNCDELTTIYANIDFSKAYNDLNLFHSDNLLTNIVGRFSNIKQSFFIESSPNLTVNSLMVIINGLATVTETRRLTLSRTSYDSLTNEQIAIATSNGWTVIRN